MIPEGWKLVPEDPQVEMLAAWYRCKNGHHFHDEQPPEDTSDFAAYRAMLAASPPPPVEVTAPALERLPVAFEVLDIEMGMYLTRSEEAAIKSGYEYNGLYRRAAAIRNLAGDKP